MNNNHHLVRRVILPTAPLAFACVSNSEAAIIYTNPSDVTLTATSDRVYWDMGVSGGTGSTQTVFFPAADMALFFGQNDSYVPDIDHPAASVMIGYSYVSTTSFFATKFSEGALINGLTGGPGSASFAELSRDNTGNWPVGGGQGYLGFRFDEDGNGASNNFLYGWARVSYNSDKSLTLYDFAYESNGSPINAGAGVPEPSVGALGAFFAGSAALYRRRRQAAAA